MYATKLPCQRSVLTWQREKKMPTQSMTWLLGAFVAAAVVLLLTTEDDRRSHFRPMNELLGKRLVVVRPASLAPQPSADALIVRVDSNDRVVDVPVVVVPRPSKFIGQKGTGVVATLQAKYGRDNVMAHHAGSSMAGTLDDKIAVLTNDFGTVVDVRLPEQWREADDLDEHRTLPEFVDKTLVVLRGNDTIVPGHDPSRLRVHVDASDAIDRLPALG